MYMALVDFWANSHDIRDVRANLFSAMVRSVCCCNGSACLGVWLRLWGRGHLVACAVGYLMPVMV